MLIPRLADISSQRSGSAAAMQLYTMKHDVTRAKAAVAIPQHILNREPAGILDFPEQMNECHTSLPEP